MALVLIKCWSAYARMEASLRCIFRKMVPSGVLAAIPIAILVMAIGLKEIGEVKKEE